MKTKEPVLIFTIKIGLLILGVLGVLIIAFYKVKNQDLRLEINTDAGDFSVEYTAGEIQNYIASGAEEIVINWEMFGAKELKEIDIYRYFDSVVISKISSGTIWNYGYTDEQGIHFNEEGIKKLSLSSRSFLIERIILAEALVAVILFGYILVNALKEKLNPENRDNHGPIYEIRTFIENLSKYRQYLFFAAKADLKAEVANSYLNRLWWILEPFCNMLVYVIVFGHVMGNNIERYSTFIFSALIMWNYFSHIINYSVKCVRNNRDIVTKIYVPKYVLLLTNMVLNFIKLLFSIVVLVVMLLVFRVELHISMLWIIPAYLLMLTVSFSLGMIFLHYGVFIDDLGYAVGILLNMMMFLSGVFYDVISSLPEPLNYILICCNPVALIIDSMRNALLYDRVANIPLIIVWYVLSLLVGYIGIHVVNRNENGYVKVI